jgi:hypothetical protein
MIIRKGGSALSKKQQQGQYVEFALIALSAQSSRRVIFGREAWLQQLFHHAQCMSMLRLHGHQEAGTGRDQARRHELDTCVA